MLRKSRLPKKVLVYVLIFILVFINLPFVLANESETPFDNKSESSAYAYHTFDIPITKQLINHPDGEDYEEILDGEFSYRTIRKEGALVQIQYAVGLGRHQWFIMSDLYGVVLMPNSIHLPVGQWIKNGMKEGYVVRVICAIPKE